MLIYPKVQFQVLFSFHDTHSLMIPSSLKTLNMAISTLKTPERVSAAHTLDPRLPPHLPRVVKTCSIKHVHNGIPSFLSDLLYTLPSPAAFTAALYFPLLRMEL